MRVLRLALLGLPLLLAACAGDPSLSDDASTDADAPTATDDASTDSDATDTRLPEAPDVATIEPPDGPSQRDALPDRPPPDGADDATALTDATTVPRDTTTDTTTDTTSNLRDAATDVTTDVTTDGESGRDETVLVSHPREFRGVWVATVYNINFPSSTRLTAAQQQAELRAILDVVQRNHLNAVVFQVRPEGDAVYRSSLEPWSRFLTGRQGGDPGYDPLALLVTEAHRRGIEVHAWFNPYRAKGSASSTAVAPHLSVTHPDAVVPYNGALWMNPASPAVQDRLLRVIRDVVTRYDIDGVHFDDYFYPYPASGMPFPDAADYERYRMEGGTMSLGDWRRHNVDEMVRRVSETIASLRPSVRFGISPFGIYRPGMPPGITGLDAYNAIYCDPLRWMREGWVDYLAPQLYWPSTQTAQAYGTLIAWWAGITSGGRSIFAGNNLGQLGSSSAWTVEEFRRQVMLTRAQEPRGARGNVWFTVQPFASNRMGIADVFRSEFYTRPVLTPPMAGRRPPPDAPTATASNRTLRFAHPRANELRAWVVYRETSGAWQLEQIVPAATATTTVAATGRYAVSAVNRFGDESRGSVVTVR